MKEKMWMLVAGVFAVGAVLLTAMRILEPTVFAQAFTMVMMAVFAELRVSSNNKSWTEWGEQQKAEFAALIKAATDKKPE
jgi:uncharacterized membrane protein YhaH (DUF805 family)